MNAISRITVILDPSAATHPALEKSAALARQAQASLKLFVCDHDPSLVARLILSPEALSAARVRFLKDKLKWLEGLARPLRESGLSVECDASWDSPLYAGLLREISLDPPDLVVKDTHWHAPLRRGLFTSTDWHLIKGSTAPILLVKPSPWAESPRISAALDPGHPGDPDSELDRRILAAADVFATALKGKAEAVHVYPTADGSGPVGFGAATGRNVVNPRESAEVAMNLLLAGSGSKATLQLLEGAALERLPAYCAESPVDVLVTGAIARSRAYEKLIGGTAERLLDRVSSDLLVIRLPAPE